MLESFAADKKPSLYDLERQRVAEHEQEAINAVMKKAQTFREVSTELVELLKEKHVAPEVTVIHSSFKPGGFLAKKFSKPGEGGRTETTTIGKGWVVSEARVSDYQEMSYSNPGGGSSDTVKTITLLENGGWVLGDGVKQDNTVESRGDINLSAYPLHEEFTLKTGYNDQTQGMHEFSSASDGVAGVYGNVLKIEEDLKSKASQILAL